MQIEGRVGPQVLSDGAQQVPRMGKDGAFAAQDAHARYQEAVYRGGVYSSCTAAAGVAPGTALGTTPPFALYNPTASGKNLVILRTSLGYVSGTLGAGTIMYAKWSPQVASPTGGTAGVVQSNLLGGGSAGSGLVFSGSTLSGSPLVLRPAFTLGAFLASTASINPPLVDEVAGEFIVSPGGVFVMQGITAAGASPLVLFGCSWEEIPV